MRVSLIHNPTAGAGNVSRDRLIKLLRTMGYNPRYQSTKDPEFPSILDDPLDLAIAAGGDGTVTKVAVNLPESNPAIAIIPLGTANNIATDLGIIGTPEEIIQSWATASRQSFDLWTASGSWGRRLFLEGCGLGVFTLAALDMHHREISVSDPSEKLAIARHVWRKKVMECEPIAVSACLGDRVIEGHFLFLEMLNIGFVGPRLSIAPKIYPTDRWLDLAYLEEEGRSALLEWLDTETTSTDIIPITFSRCQRLNLSWRKSPIRVGDDFFPETDFDNSQVPQQAKISLAPRTLTILTPKSYDN
ncbi:MAG: diacylglycerol kinase family protein [Oscillatoria sp. PMC 1051.18]|nr:diacylglycerol kinase family protein [Oscillatoria sp. PMC 1050.18]MEC5032279.1 diacylglycerol kinase family protein [Oscillatoria sp. PMC 1051.18]